MQTIQLSGEKILRLLDQKYIHGTNICQQAKTNRIKWQNIKRGFTDGFTNEELLNLNNLLNSFYQEIERALAYHSALDDLLNSPFIILKPLLMQAEASETQYDRCLRIKRKESVADETDYQLIKKAFIILQNEMKN